jgi:sulfite reductase (NADPH) hemoprotein beta-component
VPEVIEAVLETYRQHRTSGETFIATLRRVGMDPYKAAAKSARIAVVEQA